MLVGQLTKFSYNGGQFEMLDTWKTFCMEYVQNGFNGTQAAIKAGYSPDSAAEQSTRLLRDVNIRKFIDVLKADIAFCLGISAVDVAREYMKIGFGNIADFFDEDGNVADLKSLPKHISASVASIEVFEEYQGRGAAREYIGKTKKLKLWPKVDALDKLAKMVGWDGVTKIAQVTTDGKDVVQLPKKELHENQDLHQTGPDSYDILEPEADDFDVNEFL